MYTIHPQVSFIIINYDTDALTLQSVASVFKFVKEIAFEIIVVDNNSEETKLATTLSGFKNTFFYALEKNIGFGKANNYGYSKSSGDYIFLLNSDAYLIDENTIPKFIDYLKNHKKVGCVGGNLVTAKGEANISYGKFLSTEKMLHDYGIKNATSKHFYANLSTSSVCYFGQPTPVDYLTAAAMMIRRELIEKLGFFDARYFMYFEDMDLCYRYKKKGYLSVVLPDVKIVHIGGQSGLNTTQNNFFLNKQIHRSKYLFLQNVTNKPTAYVLFQLGKIIPIFTRIKRKIKGVTNG
jgi:GT2 family glycosyltransferase